MSPRSSKTLLSLGYVATLAVLSLGVAVLAQGSPAQPQLIDTSKPFDHDTHLKEKTVGKKLSCESCHQGMVDDGGTCPKQEVRFPKHEACTGCHAMNFFTPPLTICTSCHTAAEFKKDNALKDLGRQVTPRKAEFNHRLHLASGGKTQKKLGEKIDCTSCHKPKKKGQVVTHPSHPSCCACHTKADVEPKMSSCSSCHSQGRSVGRPASKIHSFLHNQNHMVDKDGSSMACTKCHVNGHEAKTLRQIQIPPMATCITCHDGEHAWHFSSCLKCHKEGTMSAPLPASHPTTPAPEGAKK